MHDVMVIGGGVIGLTLAFELAERGLQVTVLDQGALGQEASWAGAGMLPPGNPALAREPEAVLRAASHVLWPDLTARLRELTGMDNGYRRCGGLEVRRAHELESLAAEVRHWREEEVSVETVGAAQLRELEPELNRDLAGGYFLPEMGQVRNPRHLKALIAAVVQRGVMLQPGTPVYGWRQVAGKVQGVETPAGRQHAGRYVVCGGAWSGQILAAAGVSLEIRPIRGQIALLSLPVPPLKRIVNLGPMYLVPRNDGRVLIGATEESVGFEKRNTGAGVRQLLGFGAELLPALEHATLERCWSGLRPRGRETIPIVGPVPLLENVYVATGHFRNGLQMSPGTARLLADLLQDRSPSLPAALFSPARFQGSAQVSGN